MKRRKNKEDLLVIGQKIKHARKIEKLTQSEVANKIKVTKATISKWENGKTDPGAYIFMQICNILKIN